MNLVMREVFPTAQTHQHTFFIFHLVIHEGHLLQQAIISSLILCNRWEGGKKITMSQWHSWVRSSPHWCNVDRWTHTLSWHYGWSHTIWKMKMAQLHIICFSWWETIAEILDSHLEKYSHAWYWQCSSLPADVKWSGKRPTASDPPADVALCKMLLWDANS